MSYEALQTWKQALKVIDNLANSLGYHVEDLSELYKIAHKSPSDIIERWFVHYD